MFPNTSRLFNLTNILTHASRALNIANQAIPLYKEIKPMIGNIVINKRKPVMVEALCCTISPVVSELPTSPIISNPKPVKKTAKPEASFTTNVCILKITLSSLLPVFD